MVLLSWREISSEFKVTTNKYLVVSQHPLPRLQEILTEFNGGQNSLRWTYHMPTDKLWWRLKVRILLLLIHSLDYISTPDYHMVGHLAQDTIRKW